MLASVTIGPGEGESPALPLRITCPPQDLERSGELHPRSILAEIKPEAVMRKLVAGRPAHGRIARDLQRLAEPNVIYLVEIEELGHASLLVALAGIRMRGPRASLRRLSWRPCGTSSAISAAAPRRCRAAARGWIRTR